ncbi:hypothetical protein Krad_4166 [Kineococcus radiotolerans SRS30216 = ATCC BAA-149]|uniref:Uncharacterized protein n=1 Tax=Kineococcus radiotolerans (strain ATCC BAA-149 / DSM 14245 / SRS30216) TaxID=266940 RepID=A6WFP0_KINRD|nr:hypothetical protein Krad_4166 [Kineococcus radiotolerans SRS30216 = ATCC BAA-149]
MLDSWRARRHDRPVNRYRVTAIAHRRCAGFTAGEAGSGIVHVETVRAEDAGFARDLVLVRLHAESALVSPAPVGVDAVLVERVRWGRAPVRELDRRRVVALR